MRHSLIFVILLALGSLFAQEKKESRVILDFENGADADAVKRAAAHLDNHLADELYIPALAREIGMSQNWLAKAFRDVHGQTLQRYLLARRIEHAQSLLMTTDLPIARIAERLGFGDSQYFNKQFRRLAGCNPTAYRLRGGR